MKFNILKVFTSRNSRVMLMSFNIMVVPTEKFVINLSGFMQFAIGSLSVINKLNHKVYDPFYLTIALIIGKRLPV